MSDNRTLVLIADDDSDILELVAFRLGHAGYETVTADDGAEALRLARERQPALVILDVTMPKMDGYEVTGALRADEATRETPVILLTARAQENDVSRGFEAGADDYMRKPFSPQELTARVQAILGRR